MTSGGSSQPHFFSLLFFISQFSSLITVWQDGKHDATVYVYHFFFSFLFEDSSLYDSSIDWYKWCEDFSTKVHIFQGLNIYSRCESVSQRPNRAERLMSWLWLSEMNLILSSSSSSFFFLSRCLEMLIIEISIAVIVRPFLWGFSSSSQTLANF